LTQTVIPEPAEVRRDAAGVDTLAWAMTALDPVVVREHAPDIEVRLIEIAEFLAGCQDVQFLQRHRGAWARLLLAFPDVVASRLLQAIRSCSGGCRVRQFWVPLMAETFNEPAGLCRVPMDEW
jgi:hypothetical protein